MPGFQPYVIGTPGMRSALTAELRRVLSNPSPLFFPGNRWINGILSRDVGNTPYTDCLRAGLVMGPVTSGGLYANSFLGTLTNAEANGSTQIEVSAASAVEIVRRIGATGTLTITGPPAAAGVVRSATATYSAVNTTTGAITITALSADEVQTVIFGAAATGGTVKIGFTLASGAIVWTDTAAWSATDATFLSNINAAIDNVLGSGLVVATARSAVDTDLGFVLTYSGAGYTALPQSLAAIDASALTSVTTVTVTRTTAGVSGAFIAGSFVGPTDGSQVPTLILTDGPAKNVTDLANLNGVSPVEMPQIPIAATILTAYLIDYPTDTSLKTWLKQSLSTLAGPKFTFDDAF